MKKMWFPLVIALVAGIIGFLLFTFPSIKSTIQKVRGKRTAEDVVAQYGNAVNRRLQPYLSRAGFGETLPQQLALLAFKQEQRVEVWGKNDKQWKHIKSYPFAAMNGTLGPKLQEGDGQVPEGLYHIEYMNPNSSYHLSFKVNYPNDFDRAMAETDGRTRLGGDIFFHGKALTIGCIPVGDEAIEELFILVHKTGKQKVQIIIAPQDFRKSLPLPINLTIQWTSLLYETIKQALQPFR